MTSTLRLFNSLKHNTAWFYAKDFGVWMTERRVPGPLPSVHAAAGNRAGKLQFDPALTCGSKPCSAISPVLVFKQLTPNEALTFCHLLVVFCTSLLLSLLQFGKKLTG